MYHRLDGIPLTEKCDALRFQGISDLIELCLLEGQFTLSNATGVAAGSSKLKIRKGSSGTYACFGETPFGPVAGTTHLHGYTSAFALFAEATS